MNQPPIISICVANYNGMTVIDDCLKSVITQTGELAIEVIIHDDASSDGSVTHIRKHYPDAHLIESKNNVGFCIANNRMAEVAKGEYLLLLNNDAALYPDAMITLHRAALEVGRPAILGLPQYDFDSGELLDIGSLLDPFLNPVPNKDPQRSDVGMVMGACLWIPKMLWYELGGFPEWFGSIGEDLYLCCRARLAGYPVQAHGNSGYRHKVGMSFGGGKVKKGRLSTTRQRRALSERNKTYVMVLTYPRPIPLALFPMHLLALLCEGALLALFRHEGSLFRDIYLACPISLWQKRYHLSDLRRSIQSRRRSSLANWLSVFLPWPYKIGLLYKHGLPSIR